MGCDIHLYVEKRKEEKWQIEDNFIASWPVGSDRKSITPYDDRNYILFAWLANVRNGYGTAGCDTGDAIVPIDLPRGLPEDISVEVAGEADEWGYDGHSHSYFTLKELIEAYERDKDKIKIKRGWISFEEYKKFVKGNLPSSYCGGVLGLNIMHMSMDEADAILNGDKDAPENAEIYVQVEWKTYLKNCIDGFYSHTIPQLKERSESRNYDDIRIVFWFDN
jgi:hypothetical protein